MEKDATSTPSAKPVSKHPVRDNILSLAWALLVVFAIRWSVIESFKIPSGSMIPTLAVGDYLFVDKFAYGFKFPFTQWTLFGKSIPHHGDIIVFKWPRDESIYFIKRVIGLPGDTIEVKNKEVYLNGKALPRELMKPDDSQKVIDSGALFDPQIMVSQPLFYREHLDQVTHTVVLDPQNSQTAKWGPYTVPGGAIFAMGDNRDNSNDSRYWGVVPMENIAGKAMIVWMSVWFDFGEQKMVFHPGRIGTILH